MLICISVSVFSFGILPLETPSPNEAKQQSIPFITPIGLSEANVESKAPRKVRILRKVKWGPAHSGCEKKIGCLCSLTKLITY